VHFKSNLAQYLGSLFFGDQVPTWFFDHTRGILGSDKYNTGNMSGKEYDDYPYEAQGQITSICFQSKDWSPWACRLSPLHPNQ
jgi:hypothetical protein